MAEVTVMVLEVDLQCTRCYKKVKKVLCKFPQIRDQLYDEQKNRVTIRVVCCNPERMRDKLCCKGGGSIKSIEIKEHVGQPALPPAKDPEKAKLPALAPEEKKKPEKAKSPPPEQEKKKEEPKLKPEKSKAKDSDPQKPALPPPAPTPALPVPILPVRVPVPEPVNVISNPMAVGYPPGYPMGFCWREYYQSHSGGPYFRCSCGGCHGGRPVYDSYGGGRSCSTYTSRSDYFNEEDASGCRIM